ncbi:MAG: hypothetical protein AAFP90_07070, partial [Planctomycetota bacterium]
DQPDTKEDSLSPSQFTLFARGLHEPLSLAFRDGWLYAVQRPEVTRMRDVNGDGRADEFETYADGWGISGDYHEYAFGSKFDAEGNLWLTLCLTGSFSSGVPYRGWCVRVTPKGETVPTTSGVRSPGGVGMNAAGDVFYTDNQGPWNGTCGLKHLVPGSFVGHPGGFKWYDMAEPILGKAPALPNDNSRMMKEADRISQLEPTAVMFPYNKMGKSASGITCDRSAGKFGPFADQLFVADQSGSILMRVDMEKVQGHYQGACFPFLSGFGSGGVGVEQIKSGSVYVGGTNRGWGSVGNKPFAVERVDWTGRVPLEVKTMRLQEDGFRLTFTKPVDPAVAADVSGYKMETYTYIYRAAYGSPEVDHTKPTITAAMVSDDGYSVLLKVDGLQRGHVHELIMPSIQSADKKETLLHNKAYYTLNYFKK